MSNLLFLPLFFQISWAAMLYVLLTIFRAPTVWGVGAKPDGTNPFAKFEPRVSTNLTNQFE
jgi:hypothetical protein